MRLSSDPFARSAIVGLWMEAARERVAASCEIGRGRGLTVEVVSLIRWSAPSARIIARLVALPRSAGGRQPRWVRG